MEIVIFYEHKVRELPALRLLRDELQSRGHNVSIYSIAFEWYDAYSHAKRYGVDVLLIPWCYYAGQFWRFSPFIEINDKVKLINLHHEQITPQLTESVLMPRDKVAGDYPFHLCWSNFFKEELIKWGVDSKRISVVGNLRIVPIGCDSVSRESLARKYALDVTKKWILFSESRRIDAISIDKIREDFTHFGNVSDMDCDTYFDRWRDSLRIFIQQVVDLPGEFFDQYELIYRPHPGSTIDFDLGPYPKIIDKEPISDWLNNIDIFVTWQSTSAFEAEMAGLPVLFHECCPIPDKERMPGVSDYRPIQNLAEINEDLIRRVVDEQRTSPIYVKYLGEANGETVSKYANAIEDFAAVSSRLDVIPYDRKWKLKMWGSEVIIKRMKALGLIRRLHWPHTASMMYADIPFGDSTCKDLHD